MAAIKGKALVPQVHWIITVPGGYWRAFDRCDATTKDIGYSRTIGVTSPAGRTIPGKEKNMDVWRSIRFFLFIVIVLTLLSVVFFAAH